MKILGLIPARARSKRVPHKNLQRVGALSLWEIAVKVAAESGVLADIAISTDDDEIIDAVVNHPWLNARVRLVPRPAELAQDDTPMMPVIEHAYKFMHEMGSDYSAVMLLQPTSPFRLAGDLIACVKIMQRHGADAVHSVTDAPVDAAFGLGQTGLLFQQKGLVVENGAIYLLKGWAISSQLGFYRGAVYAYQMPKDRSLDINTQHDLDVARNLAAKS